MMTNHCNLTVVDHKGKMIILVRKDGVQLRTNGKIKAKGKAKSEAKVTI